MNTTITGCDEVTKPRVKSGDLLHDFAERAANKASNMYSEALSTLDPVVTPLPPEAMTCCEGCVEPEPHPLPPFVDGLQKQIESVIANIDATVELLRRVDV